MKKMLSIVLVMTLVSSIVQSVLADEARNGVEIDVATQREAQIMGNKTGAYIRLLQLEKVITIHIIQGEYLISVLANDTIDTSELEAILAELELVKGEVQLADPNASDAIQTFIDLKNDSISLVTAFRTKIHTLVDNETAEGFKNQIENMSNGDIENLGQTIQEMVREYNADRLEIIHGFLTYLNESLIEGYKNGDYPMYEVKQNISEIAKNMTKEGIYEFVLQMKEYNINRAVQVHQYVADALEGFQERMQERLEERLNNIPEDIQDAVKGHMEENLLNAINALDNIGNQNGKPEDLPTGDDIP